MGVRSLLNATSKRVQLRSRTESDARDFEPGESQGGFNVWIINTMNEAEFVVIRVGDDDVYRLRKGDADRVWVQKNHDEWYIGSNNEEYVNIVVSDDGITL